jgi:hypothetical protein
MAKPISKAQVATAAQELAAMRRSLAEWLKYRTLNDQVLAGRPRQTLKVPLGYAQRVIAGSRDLAVEQDLATKLAALLGEVMPDTDLPISDLRQNPNAAVELANLALVGASPRPSALRQAGGGMALGAFPGATHPWLWPVLIVGGLLLAITTAIKTAADVAKEKERLACIQAGACTDFGFFLKVGGIAMIAYVAWNQFGVGEIVKGFVKKRRS